MNPDPQKSFDHENGFYLTSPVSRIGKLLAHYELYKKIIGLPGEVVECGVFKGASLIRWASFRNLLETPLSRRIIGFDTFDTFPMPDDPEERAYVERFVAAAGPNSLSVEELYRVLEAKQIDNVELVAGDIVQTVPEYALSNTHLRISLLHIDTDTYRPAAVALETFYPLVVPGGLIVLDDYGTFPGETRAVDQFVRQQGLRLAKLSFNSVPSYVEKP